MGWAGKKLDDEWTLWTRGGLKGIFISNADRSIEIKIPEELLIVLAAEQIHDNNIRRLEQMELDTVITFHNLRYEP